MGVFFLNSLNNCCISNKTRWLKITDWSRLVDYIVNYFPEPKYTQTDISKWASDNVPAWKGMSAGDKKTILSDWEQAIYEAEVEPEIKQIVEGKSRGFIKRIRDFLGRLF